MARKADPSLALDIRPVTPERWPDLELLFGPRGACAGCWCMWFRLKRADFDRQTGEGNRRAMKAIVEAGEVPGLLAYADGQPVGWCAVAPRAAYPVLDRSRLFKPVDDQPVWSVVCFFVARAYRGRGVTVALLNAAADHAGRLGAEVLEGYPIEPKRDRTPDSFAYHGLAAAFRRAGFSEVLRRSETRPIMRRRLG